MQNKPIYFQVRFSVANVVAVMMVDAVSIVVAQNTYITLATESVIQITSAITILFKEIG